MAIRKALVLIGKVIQELSSTDTLNINAKFSGIVTIPAMPLGGYGSASMTVASAITGDVLAAGEGIVIQPSAALPAGVTAQYAIVTATNTVTVYFTSNALLGIATPATLTLIAQR